MRTLSQSERRLDVLMTRFGLQRELAVAVSDKYGHQAEHHCAVVAQRLRDDLMRLGARFDTKTANDIPSLTEKKHNFVKLLMFEPHP